MRPILKIRLLALVFCLVGLVQIFAAPVEKHESVALEKARRYFKFEYPLGSGAVHAFNVEIESHGTKEVPGWPGRYRTSGKAYIEYYDRQGRAPYRTAREFEIVTQEKDDGSIEIEDLTVKL